MLYEWRAELSKAVDCAYHEHAPSHVEYDHAWQLFLISKLCAFLLVVCKCETGRYWLEERRRSANTLAGRSRQHINISGALAAGSSIPRSVLPFQNKNFSDLEESSGFEMSRALLTVFSSPDLHSSVLFLLSVVVSCLEHVMSLVRQEVTLAT